MTIAESLAGERPDTAVSLWLQDKTKSAQLDTLPRKVVIAYRCDRFLCEVNMGGHIGFFGWEFEGVVDTVQALDELDLAKFARCLEAAMKLLAPSGWPESKAKFKELREAFEEDLNHSELMDKLDNVVLAGSAEIERKTHEYVRNNLAVFEALD